MSYSKKALDQLEGGQIDDFKKSFQQALDNDSDDLLYSLAEELYSLGFSNYSNTIYEKLFKKYPDDDGLKINLAELAIDDDKDDKALNYLSQVSSDLFVGYGPYERHVDVLRSYRNRSIELCHLLLN